MKRTPIVVAGTMVGLAGVLGFHTSPAKIAIGIVTSTTSPGSASATPSTTTTPSSANPTTTTANTAANSNPTTTVSTGTRTSTGPVVNYYFGTLSVSVTATGKKITKVSIASLNDGGNYRSQSIDQASIPLLTQQAMTAQSAQIQGVSGASYTSAGFAQSLQGALKSLGI